MKDKLDRPPYVVGVARFQEFMEGDDEMEPDRLDHLPGTMLYAKYMAERALVYYARCREVLADVQRQGDPDAEGK